MKVKLNREAQSIKIWKWNDIYILRKLYHKLLYIHDCIIFNSSFITNTAKSSNKIYLTFHARDRNINIRPPLSPEPFVETETLVRYPWSNLRLSLPPRDTTYPPCKRMESVAIADPEVPVAPTVVERARLAVRNKWPGAQQGNSHKAAWARWKGDRKGQREKREWVESQEYILPLC